VTQRGNRRQRTFFTDDDYRLYRDLMAEWCGRSGVEIWAYCLMPNQVHLIATPETAEGLRRGIGEAHRRYARHVNFREDWRGFLWEGRFASFPLDGNHLVVAGRYIELNPVRGHPADTADGWPWRSARAHLTGRDDDLVTAAPLLAIVCDWRILLSLPADDDEIDALRRHQRTGRPLATTPSSTAWKPPSAAPSTAASPARNREESGHSHETPWMSAEPAVRADDHGIPDRT
jgi:putative transposase